MGERISSLYVEIGAKIDDLKEGLAQAKTGLAGAAEGFTSLASTVTIAMGVAAAAGLVLKKAFELGAEGAQVIQVDSAFRGLMDSVGGSASILGALRSATQGTVSDMQLMESTTRLLTGAEGTLQKAIANNLPQLWAIANAASDLNPQLGTAADMFDKITSAIQSGRTASLAQIGLAIKSTDAYNEYGDAVGLAGSKLSKEQQEEAALNAVLVKGTTIVTQASGVNDQAADSIDRMNASLANTKDAAEKKFAPGIAKAADLVTKIITATDKANAALMKQGTAVLQTSDSYVDYLNSMVNTAEANGYLLIYTNSTISRYNALKGIIDSVTGKEVVLSEAEWESARSMGAVTDAVGELSGGLSRLGEAAIPAAASLAPYAASVAAAGGAMRVTAKDALDFSKAMQTDSLAAQGLAAGLAGEIGDAMTTYSTTMSDLITQHDELTTKLQTLLIQGYSPAGKTIKELNASLLENEAAQKAAGDAMTTATNQMIYQQAAAGLDVDAALFLAKNMGLLSEKDYAVATAIGALKDAFDKNHDSMITAAEGADEYALGVIGIKTAVENLQKRNVPVTMENIAKEMEAISKASQGSAIADAATAIESTVGPMGHYSATSGDIATKAADAKIAVEGQNTALGLTEAAGTKAGAGVDTTKGALDRIKQPLADTKQGAQDLATALGNIRGSTNISVSASGFDEALGWIDKLKSGLSSIPTSITSSITLKTSGGGGTGGGPPPGVRSVLPPAQAPAGDVIQIFNPLAAAMLIEQKDMATRQRLNVLMNG